MAKGLPPAPTATTISYSERHRIELNDETLQPLPAQVAQIASTAAVAHVGYALSDSCFVYPVPVDAYFGQNLHLLPQQGRKTIFNNFGTVSYANSRDAAGATYRALKKGEIATTFTSSQLLVQMIPNLYKIAGAMLPCVFHVAVLRPLPKTASSDQVNVVEDHTDLMTIRETGFAMLSSQNAEECHDMALIAHISSMKSKVPFAHFYDGLSKESQEKSPNVLPYVQLSRLILNNTTFEQDIQAFSSTAASSESVQEGNELYFQPSPEVAEKYSQAANTVSEVMGQFNKSAGTAYKLFEYYGDERAEYVVVITGSGAADVVKAVNSMRKNWGAPIGVISVRLYRPWSQEAFISAVPASTKTIAVLDRSVDVTAAGKPLFLDVLGSFNSDAWKQKVATTMPVVISGTYGVELNKFDEVSARSVFEGLAAGTIKNDFRALSTGTSDPMGVNTDQMLKDNSKHIERPYVKIISRLFGERALVTNLVGTSSVYGSDDAMQSNLSSFGSSPEELLSKLQVHFSPESKLQANSEFGFGLHVALAQQQQKLQQAVRLVLEKEAVSPRLRTLLSKWEEAVAHRTDRSGLDVEQIDFESLIAEIQVLLEAETSGQTPEPNVSQVVKLQSFLPQFSHWIVGSDEWSDDLGSSGLHQILKSGENVNVLILDTEVYSTVKAQIEARQRQRRKKDIGLYAMTYGNAYVASVALYDSYSQVLRAFSEADAFDGPSIVLAYAPVIPQGLNVAQVENETRAAISSGYWPLYRWNPQLEKQGLKPFSLDSTVLKMQLRKFLEHDNHLSIMGKELPEFNPALTTSMDSSLDAMLLSSFAKLSGTMSDGDEADRKPLLILFGSDNGNAEGFARKLEEEGKKKGLKVEVMDMDAFPVSDLETLESPIVFVCSTAGQGEFPANAKEFWTHVSAKGTELNLQDLKFAVFGLGDSHYWPREDEKHYYCKAPKDLFNKLIEHGAESIVDLALGDDQDEDGPETGYEKFRPLLWESLGVGSEDDESTATKKRTNEDIKLTSNFLRGTLATTLEDRSTGAVTDDDTQITKFHGIYQQDNRDLRAQRRLEKKEKAFSFMIRVRVPGGVSTPEQYLAINELATLYAAPNVKITTRQAYQLQGILKWDLKGTVQGLNRVLMDSLAACGDVNRNVMANPNPEKSLIHGEVLEVAKTISDHLTPQTSAYHEIWLDKKLVKGGEERDFEPLYGPAYLPRKFKIAIAIPPSNDVDVFAHCVGFIAITDENKRLAGFNVTAGGGMGMTHNNKATFPRLANVLGFCLPHQAKEVAEKLMLIQGEYGDRVNRKHARFKYTVEDHGIDWIREQCEKRLGYALEPARPYTFKYNGDRFGWDKDIHGKHSYTLFVEGGRVVDREGFPLRTAIREIAKAMCKSGPADEAGDMRLTANQNLILGNISSKKKPLIESLLKKYKLSNTGKSGLRLNSIACAALPYCGLALAESERYLPSLIDKLDDIMASNGLKEDAIVIRMTGCPNGCGRPYLGEIGFVGRAPGIYNLYLGAGFAGERLNKLYKEALDEEAILKELAPIIKHYATDRRKEEKFGDFVIRTGYVKACDASPLVTVRAPGATFHD